MIEHTLQPDDAGQRLDRYLRKLLPAAPLSLIHRLLRQGRIRLDGAKAPGSARLEPDSCLQFDLADDEFERLTGANEPRRMSSARQLRIRELYRDSDLLAVDKPPGVATQPGSGVADNNLVDWLADTVDPTAQQSRTFRPAPAHRLDRDTSGVVLIGLSPTALRRLHEAFARGRVEKSYLAVVHGVPSTRSGFIDARLLRVQVGRGDEPKVIVDDRGRTAHTVYDVVESRGDRSLLRVGITTGRMHQIRVHLAHVRHPIVGDRRYGTPPRPGERLHLHAAELILTHPVSGKPLHISAPVPPGFWT